MAATKAISLKLLIDKNSQRVLFAEACSEFVNLLFNIFTLPLGNVIRLLKQEDTLGSLPSLYNSIKNLSYAFIQQDQHKDFLLKPKVAIRGPRVPLLLPGVEAFISGEYLRCYRCKRYDRVRETAYDETGSCPSCRDNVPSFTYSSEVGYIKGITVTYIVMDDLEVKPMFTISLITLLNELNVKEVGTIEEKVVDLGMDEGVKLLKASLQSKTVLTDVFLSRPLETGESIENEGL